MSITRLEAGARSALRFAVWAAALIEAASQAGLLNPDKLFSWKGVVAFVVFVAAKGGWAGFTAKSMQVGGA